MRKALREWADRYRILFENLNDAAFLADVETGTILEANKKAEKLLGRSRNEIVGLHQAQLHPPESLDKYRRMFAEHVQNEGGLDFDAEVIRKDGTKVPVVISASTMIIGRKRAILGLFRDRTERKRMEEDLRRRAEWERLVSSISAKFISIEPEEVDRAIDAALQDIGQFSGADRSYLVLCSNNGKEIEKTHEWCNESVEPRIFDPKAILVTNGYPSAANKMECPGAGTWHSGQQEVRSSLGVPVGTEGSPAGFLGLDLVKKAKGWSEEEIIPLLGIVAEIFSNALTREEVEEELRQSRSELAEAQRIAHLGNWVWNIQTDERAWSDEVYRIFGVAPQECDATYQAFLRAVHRDDREFVKKAIEEALVEHESYSIDHRIVLSNGSERVVHTQGEVTFDEAGKPVTMVGTVQDITERKRAETALREAHRQTEQLLSAVPSIVIGVDIGGTVTRWNASAEKTFGIAAQEAVGRHFGQCSIEWDWAAVLGRIEKWLAGPRSAPLQLDDVRFTRPNGKTGLLGLTVNTVVNEVGGHDGLLLFAADITERRRLESQLNQAQKLESIGQLAAGIAHEINTPTQYVGDNTRFLKDSFSDLLGLLRGYDRLLEAAKRGKVNSELVAEIEAAARGADIEYLAEEIPKAIEQSLEGVDRVASIVRAMKEFSHLGGQARTAININRAIENTITVARNEWKYVAEMTTEFDESLPPVPCLRGEFNQVILNLITNAAHAIADVVGDGSKGKGQITVETRRVDGSAEVRMSDTGAGIPKEIRDRIFDPFFTTKKVGRGTGQGLTIAHSVIVDKHGGTINFETEMGRGTTFIIRLPLEYHVPKESN
jgi:PAS domain S-box-containing protein